MRWCGPENFTAPVVKIDLHVGGKYLCCLRLPEGQDFWSTGVYRKIVPLEWIVATDSFADQRGNMVSATQYGISPEFPRELLVTVTFEDLRGTSKLTLRHTGLPVGEHRRMAEAGWDESFDKLSGE